MKINKFREVDLQIHSLPDNFFTELEKCHECNIRAICCLFMIQYMKFAFLY